MFSVESVIATAISNIPDAERKRWKEYQETELAKLKIDDRSLFGRRQIELALAELNTDEDYTRLAEGYYLIGELEKAAELTRDPLKKQEYGAILNATERDCSCPSEKFAKEEFPQFTIYACPTCGHLRKC